MSRVGKAIRSARKERGQSIADVARATGRSDVHVQAIESGRLRGTPGTLRTIGAYLGIPAAILRAAYIEDARNDAGAFWNQECKASISKDERFIMRRDALQADLHSETLNN